jgi:hypothetical protein
MVLGFSVVVYSFGWSDCCGQEIDGVDAGWFPHTPTRACFFLKSVWADGESHGTASREALSISSTR